MAFQGISLSLAAFFVSLVAVALLIDGTSASRPDAKKILGFAWPGGKSHGFAVLEIMNKLAERGHQPTIVAWSQDTKFLFKDDRVRAGVEFVGEDLTWSSYKEYLPAKFFESLNLPGDGEKWDFDAVTRLLAGIAAYPNPMEGLPAIHSLGYDSCVGMLAQQDVVKKIRSTDYMVSDGAFLCTYVAAWLFDKQITAYSPVGSMNGLVDDEIVGPSGASYTPMIMHPAKVLTSIMTPAQQVHNKIFEGILKKVVMPIAFYDFMDKVVQHPKVRANLNTAELARIDNNKGGVWSASIRQFDEKGGAFMILTDPSLDFPRSIYSSTVYVGHPNSKEAEPLKDDGSGLKQFVDGATEGLVLMSLGTYGTLNQEHTDILAAGLNSLNMKVVWKVSIGRKPNPSTYNADNFFFKDWLPQNDILGHPNTKLMVMHGGMNGFNELSYHGVPAVGIPLLADQFDNIARGMARGYMLVQFREEFTVESITRKLNQCLSSEFSAAAAKMKRNLRAHPLSALDRMANVVEMAINMEGGGHLRPQATRMTPAQMRAPDLIILAALCLSGDAPGSESCESHVTHALALQGTQGYEDVNMQDLLDTAKTLIKAYGYSGAMAPEIALFE